MDSYEKEIFELKVQVSTLKEENAIIKSQLNHYEKLINDEIINRK